MYRMVLPVTCHPEVVTERMRELLCYGTVTITTVVVVPPFHREQVVEWLMEIPADLVPVVTRRLWPALFGSFHAGVPGYSLRTRPEWGCAALLRPRTGAQAVTSQDLLMWQSVRISLRYGRNRCYGLVHGNTACASSGFAQLRSLGWCVYPIPVWMARPWLPYWGGPLPARISCGEPMEAMYGIP